MKSNQQVLNIIKSTALQLFPDCQVMLFGSRARRDNKEDSDYDVLVIVNDKMTPNEKMPYKTKIRKTLLSKGIFSDILIQSKLEVESKKHLTGHIIKTILSEGLRL